MVFPCWNSTVTFLDPFTKTGVFPREITKRLVDGLAEQIPDLEERVDHILIKQVYGIAITHLTSLLARRSLYCSKWANGPHSIAKRVSTGHGDRAPRSSRPSRGPRLSGLPLPAPDQLLAEPHVAVGVQLRLPGICGPLMKGGHGP